MTAPDLELGFESLSNDEVAAASQRSATFDVAAVASVAGLRNSQGEVPLDDFVPRRTSAGCPRELDRKAKLLLAHVDGARTIEQLAQKALLPLPEAITIFFDLLALGVVECDGATTTPTAS